MRVTRLTSNRTRRRLGAAAISVASAALLTGCGQLTNDFTTNLHYDAADGVSASVAGLNAENLLVVNDGKSTKGELQGMVYNPGQSDADVTFTLGSTSKTVKVPSGQSVRLDGKPNGNDSAKAGPVDLSSLDGAKPGEQVAMTVKSGGSSTNVEVPVLLDQSPYGSASPSHPVDPQPTEKHDVAIQTESPNSSK